MSQTSVYIGLASVADCPLIRGRVYQLEATTGAIQHVFYTVPSGCTGASVWGSVTIDPADGSLYAVTGNPGACGKEERHAIAMLKLNMSNLSLESYWQLPKAQRLTPDADFGTVPTLFAGMVTPGGAIRNLVGATNKNGILYVWDRANVSAGPVAQLTVAASNSAISRRRRTTAAFCTSPPSPPRSTA